MGEFRPRSVINRRQAGYPRFAWVMLVVALLLVASADARPDRVDRFVRSEMAKQHIPGLSLAVLKSGKVIKAKGYGLANVELHVRATPETVYKIASVTKQFVAAGIMLLVEEGKIALDDPIGKHLDGGPESWNGITVRHLLTMTSGFVREVPGWSPFDPYVEEGFLQRAREAPFEFAPGEKWQYCNLGYFLLSIMIHKVSGKPWGDFLRERIFQPLGMADTRVVSWSDVVPNRADSYMWQRDTLRNAEPVLSLRPSGGLLSTVRDLAKWDAALYTERPLKRSSLEQSWTAVKLKGGQSYPYGFGWGLGEERAHRVVQHSGGLEGFRTQITRFIDDHLTVIVLTNGGAANPDAIARGVAVHYLPDLRSPTPKPAPAASALP